MSKKQIPLDDGGTMDVESKLLNVKCFEKLLILDEFKEKAIEYEKLAKKDSLNNEEVLKRNELEEYLSKHIEQYKRNSREWCFEHIEGEKKSA